MNLEKKLLKITLKNILIKNLSTGEDGKNR
jgi:hypothetical protein